MKTILSTSLLAILFAGAFAGEPENHVKTKSFTIERVISAPAHQVWDVVGEHFADIAKSHPILSSSHYVEGSPMTGEGCERVCNIDTKGKKYTREKIVNYNEEEFSFTAEISEAGGLPLDASQSRMYYDVNEIDENSSEIILKMVYRTDPAFLGSLAKGKFKKNIENYAIAINHYVVTGEEVGPDNFQEIKKQYN